MYSKNCLEYVKLALETGNLKMTGWFDNSLQIRVVKWLELEQQFKPNLFLNANTPQDLAPGLISEFP